jgi:hypothetical protein
MVIWCMEVPECKSFWNEASHRIQCYTVFCIIYYEFLFGMDSIKWTLCDTTKFSTEHKFCVVLLTYILMIKQIDFNQWIV